MPDIATISPLNPHPRYIGPTTAVHVTRWYQVFRGVLVVAPDADHPTRTLTLTGTRTLWGDLCLDAVACELDAVVCEGFRWQFFNTHTSVGCVWLISPPGW